MKPYTNPLPAPPPSAQRPFDPWNSSSTGHQRREASRRETDGVSETAWRAARTAKLNRQFQTQERVLPPPPRPDSKPLLQRKSVAEMLAKPGSMNSMNSVNSMNSMNSVNSMNSMNSKQSLVSDNEQRGPRLFTGIVVYVNGSTAPLVSDHHLKTTLVAHGARVALHLARRQVTHVVLGRSAGGLAGTKKDKEIRRRGGCGIKYVGVEWVLESIRAGTRLPEARFAPVGLAPHGQNSVYGMARETGHCLSGKEKGQTGDTNTASRDGA